MNPKRNMWQDPQHLSISGEGRISVTLSLCFQNILGQTEEGSSRQENAQKALGAVSKVGRMEAEEG